MVVQNEQKEVKKLNETGHPKILESLGKIIAIGDTLDQDRLNPTDILKISSMQTQRDAGTILQNNIGNSRADWRTVALDRAIDIERFNSLASESFAQLEARGASRETLKNARSYVRKLQGRRATPAKKVELDADGNPVFDESEKGVSAAQTSSAAKITTMYEYIDFLEAQSEYAGVTKANLTVIALRLFVDQTQAKHDLSIIAATKLSNDRIKRNKMFYLDADCIIERARQYKKLVGGEYGFKSPEFKAINSIPFKKPKL
jgi:hypothetical protein